ncbi:hypothetical protein [Bartonella sp. DGB1]|uniref:hypothetical protein n=1 Tax=Bartonella sp. DGB1 TaxID=3239807 RepID=UPI0035235481
MRKFKFLATFLVVTLFFKFATMAQAQTAYKIETGFSNEKCSTLINNLHKNYNTLSLAFYMYIAAFFTGMNIMQLTLKDSFRNLDDLEKDPQKYITVIIKECNKQPNTQLRSILLKAYNSLPVINLSKEPTS